MLSIVFTFALSTRGYRKKDGTNNINSFAMATATRVAGNKEGNVNKGKSDDYSDNGGGRATATRVMVTRVAGEQWQQCDLSRDFLLYSILCTIVPGPKPPSLTQLLRKTTITMVMSGFGLYHGLWIDDPPTKHIGVILTPWMMTCVLGFVEILLVHE
jgi:hypothetical protein